MNQITISANLLRFSGFAIGLTIPLLFLGRAAVGVCIGLSVISLLFAGDHKGTWRFIQPYLNRNLLILFFILIVSTGINIPFSLNVEKSLFAWSRTWFMFGGISFIIISLRENLKVILLTMSIAILFLLFLNAFSIIHISKLVLNGYLLTLPIIAYTFYRYCHFSISFLTGAVFFYVIFSILSKASLAGSMMMVLILSSIYCFKKLSYRKALFINVGVVLLIIGAIRYLSTFMMNETSVDYGSFVSFPVYLVDIHRQFIWSFSFDLFKMNPFVGLGFNASNYHPLAQQTIGEYFGPNFTLKHLINVSIYPGHPHNWILELFIEGGLIGAVPLMVALIWMFVKIIKAFFDTNNVNFLILLAVNIGFWGTGLFNFSFWSSWWQASFFLTGTISLLLTLEKKV